MTSSQIQQVRRFNRMVTRRVGALEDSYLQRGRPLGEARILYETGPDGADLRDLRARLGLDAGYFSRLLRSLEQQGLITVARQAGDGRRRRISLTRKGSREFATYERLSDELAASFLTPLDAARRDRLVAAMAEVERLLQLGCIDLRVEPPDSADARHCLDAYFLELAERFDAGFDPRNSLSASDAEMTPPAGYFLLARLDGQPVGCGALKCTGNGIGEIKRMWTAASARGQGVAGRVLQALEGIARDNHLTTLRLETNRTLTEAQALYRREGYREVDRFNDELYAHHWFEKHL
jgi:DNA-binding MarR family transcriptional regulator/GNAT superfamily N-acetyltransferase